MAEMSCNQLLIDSAMYLLTINSPTLNGVAMSLYDITYSICTYMCHVLYFGYCVSCQGDKVNDEVKGPCSLTHAACSRVCCAVCVEWEVGCNPPLGYTAGSSCGRDVHVSHLFGPVPPDCWHVSHLHLPSLDAVCTPDGLCVRSYQVSILVCSTSRLLLLLSLLEKKYADDIHLCVNSVTGCTYTVSTCVSTSCDVSV